MEDKKAIRISKTISYALRHNPSAFGLTLAQDGSVPVEDLLDGLSKALGRPITHRDLDEILSLPGKRRLIIEGGRIRAYYGHSVKEEVVRPQSEPPEVLYHATSHKALHLVQAEGLKPMNRQHVHLSSTKETALDAGRRRDPAPPLLMVKAHDAWTDGIRFYEGNEDIFLSDPLPPRYISIVSGSSRAADGTASPHKPKEESC